MGAIAETETETDPTPCAWSELILGRARASHRAELDGRLVLVLRSCEPRRAPVLTPHQLRIVERLGSGAAYGEIAFELDLELSTIATHVGRSLLVLGLRRIELPLLVVGPARASRRANGDIVVPYPVADTILLPELSSAEHDVVRRVLVGSSNGQIARERGTSERTVANQLCALFRKLRVCSRMELAALIAVRAARGRAREPARPVIALA